MTADTTVRRPRRVAGEGVPPPPPAATETITDEELERLTRPAGQVDSAAPEVDSAADKDAPLPEGWSAMDDAPRNHPIMLTPDPVAEPIGWLCFWRTTRVKELGRKGWRPVSFWAFVLTRQPVEFDPACWRKAMPGAAAL